MGRQGNVATFVRVLLLLGGVLVLWVGVRLRLALRERAEHKTSTSHAVLASLARGKRAVRIVHGVPSTWKPSVSLEGALMPAEEADLGFQVGGQLASVSVARGDIVREGAVLATLALEEIDTQRKAVEAQVHEAEARLMLAEDKWVRVQVLVDAGAGSEESHVQAKAQRDMVVAQMQALQAQKDRVQVQMEKHTLRAPFAGITTKVPSGIGGMVTPGAPLFHLVDMRTLKLMGSVGEQDAAWMERGSQVLVAGKELVGEITALLPVLDPATRRVLVEAKIPNTQYALRAGAWVHAEVKPKRDISVLRLPATALRPGTQGEVMVVQAGKLVVRAVSLAHASDGSLLVKTGLTQEARVWLSPVPEAVEGEEVDIMEEPAPCPTLE